MIWISANRMNKMRMKKTRWETLTASLASKIITKKLREG